MLSSRFVAARRLALAGCLAAVLAISGCHAGGPTDRVLRVGLQDEYKTLDPAIGYDVPSWSAERLIFNGLVTYDFASRVVPDLATGWTVDPSQTRYTFKLHPGVHFHDGRPVTAQDFVASFERLLDPATKSPGASFYGDIVGASERLAGKPGPALGVTAPDDRTVVITLKAPNSVFLQLLAMPFASVLPHDTPHGDLGRHAIGTGPFKLTRWRSGVSIDLLKNADYFGKAAPRIDGVTFVLGLSENLEVLKWERGDIDLLGEFRPIPAAEFVRLAQDPRYEHRMLKGPDAAFHYVGMNCRVAPFDKPLVRQAIACAIDKQRIVQLVNGRGQVAHGILPPTMPGFNPYLRGYPHDPARARALLAQAGFPHGFEATYYCVSNATARKLAQSIQQDLGAVGIRLALKPLAFPTFLEAKATAGRVGISSGNWTQDYPDPSNFLTTMFHSKNIKPTDSLNDSYYANPKVDHFLDLADREGDPATRAFDFQQAESLVVADAPVVPLYNPVKFQLVSPRVSGYKLHPVWGMALDGVSIR